MKVTINRRCGWCGAEIEVSMNDKTTVTTLKPFITMFNKMHNRQCKAQNYGDVQTKTETVKGKRQW